MNDRALAAYRKLLEPIARRIALLASRGTVQRSDDGKKLQELQVGLLAGEVADRVERFQPFGLSARPRAGAEAVVLFLGGGRDHPVAVAVDDRRSRPKDLGEGETVLYAVDAAGAVVASLKISNLGRVDILSAGEVSIAGNVTVTGNLTVGGDVRDRAAGVDGTTMDYIRATYNAHTHPGGGVPTPQMP